MSSDTSLITFKAISTFMNELGEMFGEGQHSLKLYCRLINKTTISHEAPIKKHIDAFRIFCVANREQIISKDSNFDPVNVSYSERVFVDMSRILNRTDSETSEVIWKHLLLISALVDPDGKAKEFLKNSSHEEEADFIKDIINKVEENVDPDSNPMQAISSIMQSGVFTDLIGGMNRGLDDGSLDLGKLMGTVSGMISTLGNQGGQGGDGGQGGEQVINMINTMMGSIMGGMDNNTNSDTSTRQVPPDMPDIMAIMGPMMSALGGLGNTNSLPPRQNATMRVSEDDKPFPITVNGKVKKEQNKDDTPSLIIEQLED